MRHESEIDTMLSELYVTKLELEIRLGWEADTIRRLAGDKPSGYGARRSWSMTLSEAETKLELMLEAGQILPHEERNARRSLERLELIRADLVWVRDEGRDLEWITGPHGASPPETRERR